MKGNTGSDTQDAFFCVILGKRYRIESNIDSFAPDKMHFGRVKCYDLVDHKEGEYKKGEPLQFTHRAAPFLRKYTRF